MLHEERTKKREQISMVCIDELVPKNHTKKREQISMVCIDELVPKNHLLRKIDRVIDWSFILSMQCSSFCMW